MRAIGTVLTKSICVRVTEEEHRIFMERGGSEYLRQVLSGNKGSTAPSGGVTMVDIEAVVRRMLAEGKTPSVVPTEEVPKVVSKKSFEVEVDPGVDRDITDSIKSMFGM